MSKKSLSKRGNKVPAKSEPAIPEIDPSFKREIVQAGGLGPLIQSACGCKHQGVADSIYIKCAQTSTKGLTGQDLSKEMQTTLYAIGEMSPQDVVESALVSSFWAVQSRAMNLLSMDSEINLNLAVKLLRVRHEVLDSLLKWRRRGEQRFVVQHQHVNVEGPVGNLVTGGGVIAKMEASSQPEGGTIDAS